MSGAVSEDKIEREGVVITSDEEVKRFLKEGEKLLDDGEIVQACEKIYKAAEDAVKLLAEAHVPDISREAKRRGRWTVSLLDKAVRNLEIELGEDVGRGWAEAWILHVEGFHEIPPSPAGTFSCLKNFNPFLFASSLITFVIISLYAQPPEKPMFLTLNSSQASIAISQSPFVK